MSPILRSRFAYTVVLVGLELCIATVTFAVAVVADRSLIHDRGRPDLWLLLVAAGVVAALLTAVRPFAERLAGRLVYRERADAYEMVTAFVGRMASTLAVDDVLPQIAETAARSVHSSRSEVRLWLDGGEEWRQVWPIVETIAPLAPGQVARGGVGEETQASTDGGHIVEVAHRGSAVGEIGVAGGPALAPADQRVLEELARPAGVALSTVRLTFALRRRVEEMVELVGQLERSRQRLVRARQTERARIRAELDERVRPHLLAAGDELARARRGIEAAGGDRAPDSEVVGAALDAARGHALEALEALRLLARGIFPAVLADAGLLEALTSWAGRQQPPVTVTASGELGALRSWPAAEAACYTSCVGLLAGIGTTDPGVAIGLVATSAGIELRVELPGAPAIDSAVLEAVSDQIGALGGAVTPTVGSGATVLTVWLPLDRPIDPVATGATSGDSEVGS